MKNDKKQRELVQAVKYLKLTIPRMTSLEVPITPENYTVWYEYTSGANLELTKAIDDMLNSGLEFTSEINRELYDTYITSLPSGKLVGVQGETEQIVRKLLGEIKGMYDGAQSFSSTLKSSQEELLNNPDISSVSRLVSNLIEETDKVKQANSAMEKTLTTMKDEVDCLKSDMEALSVAALTDQLTGISNRRAFNEAIEQSLEDFNAEGTIFSLLVIDIDHFKKFNDTHGHTVGDMVLTFVAKMLKKGVKGTDMVARYGGEEFVVILPKTDYDGAITVAQLLCDKVSQTVLTMNEKQKKSLGNVTISVGVALITSGDDAISVVERADLGLYAAKESGRNRVVGEKGLAK